MIKSLFIINGKNEENYLFLFKDKFICSEEKIPKELCLLEDDELEKRVVKLIKNDKECKLALGPQKSLFFADLNNQDKKLKDLPSHKIIKCNILGVDEKYFMDKGWYFTLIIIASIVIIGIGGIYLSIKGHQFNPTTTFLPFGCLLLIINFYRIKILEKIYYKKVLKNFKS